MLQRQASLWGGRYFSKSPRPCSVKVQRNQGDDSLRVVHHADREERGSTQQVGHEVGPDEDGLVVVRAFGGLGHDGRGVNQV